MLDWVRPRIVVPVHGEALHMAEHAALARSKGIKQVLTCRDGDLVRLAPGDAEIIDEVPAGRVYKDGILLVDGAQRTVADRRRLGFAGVISVALALSAKGDLVADPDLHLMGIPEKAADGAVMAQIAYDAVIETVEGLSRPRRRDPDTVAEAVRRAVRARIAQRWNKKPICHVHLLEV
jgi:ribonuclease J